MGMRPWRLTLANMTPQRHLAAMLATLALVCAGERATAMPTDFLKPASSYPACRAKDLAAQPYVYRLQGVLRGLALRNASKRTCSLVGYPTLRIVDDGGNVVQIDYEQRNVYNTVANAFALLGPHQRTFFGLTSASRDSAANAADCATYRRLRIIPPGDLQSLSTRVTLTVCERTVTVSPFYPLPN